MAVDPGGDTGVAIFHPQTKIWTTYEMAYEPIVLYEFFLEEQRDFEVTVICERFDYRPVGKYNFGGSRAIPKVDLTPREVIGILKLSCAYFFNEIIWQAPGDVNGDDGKKTDNPSVFWTDEKVKKLGLYKPGHVHEMDAVKHILYYRAFTRCEHTLFHALKFEEAFGENEFKEVMT
jgi:hypothetical protein